MQRLFSVIFFFFLFFFFAPPLFADEGWVIDNFHANLFVEKSGEVTIVETIDVDFKNLSKHGIYRDIPYVYESENEKTYTEITVDEAQQNNKRAEFSVSKNDGYVRIKIGDPDKTISGKNKYVISYSAKGVLKGFSTHDELYWNVTGNNWGVPILHADATVTLPSDGITQVLCFQGYNGSQGECAADKISSKTAQFSTTEVLSEAQGLTLVTGFTKGLVPLITVPRPLSFWEKFISWPSQITLLFSILFGCGTVFFIWYKNGRDYWHSTNLFAKKSDDGVVKPMGGHETVVVEFSPPEKLRPAEIGVLMDERADTRDVVATIIDLAGRGFLTITEVPKKWVFGKVDYTLTKKTKDAKDLLSYEKKLLDKLFKTGTEVTISNLKTTFYTELQEIKQDLYNEVVTKKLFPSDPEKIRGKYVIIGIIFLVIGVVLTANTISADLVFLADISLGLVISGIVLLIFSQSMPRRTAYGRSLYRQVKGYQLFISGAEKYRQQFFEKKHLFNDILPYAIVFGLTEKFAKQMQDMGVKTTQPTWYVGTHPFHTATFGSNIDDFSNSLSSAIASAPSSSGFSSGGSSGGGFGGGGGGSW